MEFEKIEGSRKLSLFAKISSTMTKRRATVFPAVPKYFQHFDSLLENSDLGRIEDNVFYRTYDKFALIFLPDLDINVLDCVESIHVDAKFKTVPSCFYQLLIIHCIILDTIVPVLYVLMTSKSRLLYDSVSLQIRCLAPGFRPQHAVSDYEHALFSSIKLAFDSETQGCYFHFRQNLWRKWQQLGLSTIKVKEVNTWLNMVMSLHLLPSTAIRQAFFELSPSLFDINVP